MSQSISRKWRSAAIATRRCGLTCCSRQQSKSIGGRCSRGSARVCSESLNADPRECRMLSRFRHLPLVRQAETTECGHACLAMIACWFGHEIDLVSLRLQQSTSSHGSSVHSLAMLAEQFDLRARALRLEPVHLRKVKLPAI